MAKKIYRLQKRVGSKARILKPYKIKKTGFSDIGLYARFPWHQTYVDPFVGGWSVALNHPCFDQQIWNTRTIPVIAVNDLNSGIIDLAWCLLYIPWNFKMSVKNAIHCQGLWNECRDKALLDRFRSSLRFYYSLEANFHKKEFEEGMRNYYRESSAFRGIQRKDNIGYVINQGYKPLTSQVPNDISEMAMEDGIRKFYKNEASYGGSARGFWVRQNMNRQLGQQMRGVPPEEIENGLRHFYHQESSFRKAGTIGQKFGINKNKNRRAGNFEPHIIDRAPDTPMESMEEGLRQWYRTHVAWDLKGDKFTHQVTSTRRPVTDLIPETDERAHEEGLRSYYFKTHAYGGQDRRASFQWDINQNAGSLHHGEPIDPNMEDALRSWYLSQHSYGSRKAFRFSQNEQRNMNVGSEGGEIDPSFEEGMQNWYKRTLTHGGSGKSIGVGINKGAGQQRNCGTRLIPRDYYDEIHSRLRWMQIFNEGYKGGIYNEDFARFLKRFVGKMDNGFLYLDPTYFKTLTGKHYEDVLTLEQHKELSGLLHEADKTNTKFLLSYDVDERVDKLYSSFDFETIQVPYSVARSYGDGRAQSDEEYLIRNYNIKEDPYMKKVDFTKKTKLDTFFP